MSENLTVALKNVVGRLQDLATTDAEFRAELRELARALLDVVEAEPSPRGGHQGNGSPRPAPAPPPPLVIPRLPDAMVPPEALADAHSRKGTSEEVPITSAPGPRWAPVSDADLPLLEQRCRLKADASRWAAQRRRRMREGGDYRAEIEPRDQDMIARAKQLPDCFLWMCHPSGPEPSNLRDYDTLAACFEVTAEAIALVRTAMEDRDAHRAGFERSLDLLAEAQSALRTAVNRFDGQTDPDQTRTFHWLRTTASEHQVFIRRHMRADDPADPVLSSELSARVEELDAELQDVRKLSKVRRKAMGKIRHKASVILNDPDADHRETWFELAAVIDELIAAKLPPSNAELRELLLPIVDLMPEDVPEWPPNVQLVLRELDHYLALSTPAESSESNQEPSEEVKEVAELLVGRSAVLIGGDRRPSAHAALKQSFGLDELYWIETREHQSIGGFEAYVRRDDVAVVFLAIRWSSHAFGEVKEFCDRYNKPLVRLPGGYNPNQVAAQVKSQCSDRLTISP